jgi:hypothetical protein
MCRGIFILCLASLALVALGTPSSVAQIPTPGKFYKAGTFEGQIVKVAANGSSVRFKTPFVSWWINPNERGIAYGTVEVTIWLPDDVVVRKPNKDEKGRPLSVTPPPQGGDRFSHLGGAPGQVEDLQPGQIVRVSLKCTGNPRNVHYFAKWVRILR